MDKRVILAFILIGIIVLFWDDYLRWLYPTQPEPPGGATDTVAVTPPSREPVHARESTPSLAPPVETATAPPRPLIQPPTEGKERLVTVETERFSAVFTTAGARLKSFTLKPNGRYIKKEIELLSPATTAPVFTFWTLDGPVSTADLTFSLEGSDDGDRTLQVTGYSTRRLRFTADLDTAGVLTLVYTFSGDGHSFTCEVEARGLASTWVRDYAEVQWTGGLAYTEADTSQDIYYSKAFTFYAGDVLEHLKLKKGKAQKTAPSSGETRWGAVRTKYFIAALIPETAPATGAWMEDVIDSGYVGSFPPNRLGVSLRLTLDAGAPATPVRIFIGPLDEDVLAAVDPSLKKTINWGWAIIAPFSKAVLWCLKKIHLVIPNYGIGIIILSILIKVVVWPLTRKSYRSMAAMQRLQPKIKELREKYKNDPQRMQKETMKLYKEEKVNPMGGCLPMVLQMPLLYAMFIVLRSTIEFRSAPFFWWIKDLSMPDVVYHLPMTLPMYGNHISLLPILMAISTFFQSRGQMTDPNQKFMLYFMPAFMLIIFNQFPSGLTLYWTLFNVWTIVQQKITPPPQPAAASSESGGG